MEKMSLFSKGESPREPKECDFSTKEQLRKLYAESLGNGDLTWSEIHEETEKGLGYRELGDVQCFFDLETGEPECYSVPKVDIPPHCE